MTLSYFTAVSALADETSNGFGITGVLDRFGNVFGIVLCAAGLLMVLMSLKVRKMGSFYLEMNNHDPIIKETGYLPAVAEITDRRSSEIAGKTFSEVELTLTLDGESYSKWTPDLGLEGEVRIEYDPKDPNEFYIMDKVEADEAPNVDEDGVEVEDLKEPPNKAFYAMLIFGLVLVGLGVGFLYDFYL